MAISGGPPRDALGGLSCRGNSSKPPNMCHQDLVPLDGTIAAAAVLRSARMLRCAKGSSIILLRVTAANTVVDSDESESDHRGEPFPHRAGWSIRTTCLRTRGAGWWSICAPTPNPTAGYWTKSGRSSYLSSVIAE
jgi:hypothetical protein